MINNFVNWGKIEVKVLRSRYFDNFQEIDFHIFTSSAG